MRSVCDKDAQHSKTRYVCQTRMFSQNFTTFWFAHGRYEKGNKTFTVFIFILIRLKTFPFNVFSYVHAQIVSLHKNKTISYFTCDTHVVICKIRKIFAAIYK